MQVKIYNDYEALSQAVAVQMAQVVKEKPTAVIAVVALAWEYVPSRNPSDGA